MSRSARLRRATTYPMAADRGDGRGRARRRSKRSGSAICSTGSTKKRPWEQTLSGGEKQRLAFARLLIHKPNLIVLDEATSALDPESQERLMHLINEKIPEATVISVGHRPELEAFHERKLVLKHQTGGARLIRDEYLTFIPGPRAKLFRRVLDWRRRRRGGEEELVAQSRSN